MLGPTNCLPDSSVTMQIWHPGSFSIPLVVVDSISDSKRVYAEVADVISQTRILDFQLFQ